MGLAESDRGDRGCSASVAMQMESPPSIALSPLVWTFAHLMQEQLDENSDKSGWEGLSPQTCLDRIANELNEAREAVINQTGQDSVRRECADIANFAAFLAATYTDPACG